MKNAWKKLIDLRERATNALEAAADCVGRRLTQPRNYLESLGAEQPPEFGLAAVRIGIPGRGMLEVRPPTPCNGWLWSIWTIDRDGSTGNLIGCVDDPWSAASNLLGLGVDSGPKSAPQEKVMPGEPN